MDKEIDFDLLEKTVKFPLRKDEYGWYIWSKINQMIAQLKNCDHETKTLFIDRVCGEIRTFTEEVTEDAFELTKNFEFKRIDSDAIFGLVRGWGDFQYNTNKKGIRKYDPKRGVIIHDNLAAYFLKCLNTPRKNA